MKKREPNDVDPRFCVYQVRLFAVVWCLHGDVHVVWMALEETGVGDAHEDALLLEGGDVGRTAIAHAGTDTATELVESVANSTFISYATLDALWNEFAGRGILRLK